MATTKLMTAEDLYEMEDHGGRNELIRGELREMPPAGGDHGEIGLGIAARIWNHVTQHNLGKAYLSETGFILAREPDVVVAPDASFVSINRVPPREKHRGYLEVAPDLVVEVISPTDRYGDVDDKVMIYLEAGVQLVWVVNPRLQTVTVHSPNHPPRRLTANDELDGGDVLPGFSITVSDLFSR